MVCLNVPPVLSSLAFFPPKRRGVSPSSESPAGSGGKKADNPAAPRGQSAWISFPRKKPAAYGCRASRGMTARLRAGGSRERQTGATSALAHLGNSAGVFGEVALVLAIEFFTAPGLDPATAAKRIARERLLWLRRGVPHVVV